MNTNIPKEATHISATLVTLNGEIQANYSLVHAILILAHKEKHFHEQ